MERLTFEENIGLSIDKGNDCPSCYVCWACDKKVRKCPYFKDAIKKLKQYEDMEERLENVYGECDGLLETAAKLIANIEKYGVDTGNPYKSRLLTDEDAEKWEMWKNAEEQGKLLILPCKPGDKVYAIKKRFSVCKYGRRWDSDCEYGCPHFNGCDSKSEYYIETQVMNTVRNIVIMMNKLGKTVFLTESEAQKALEVVTINGQL